MTLQSYIPKSLSGRVLGFSALIFLLHLLIFGFPANVISWDIYGYYLYLSQGLIEHDLAIENFDSIQHTMDTYHNTGTFYQAGSSENGGWVNKYSMGMAIFYLPTFIIGYLAAWIGGYPLDGFSLPFQNALVLNSLLYMLIGLYFFRKILLRYFTDKQTAAVLLFTILGTNYYQIHLSSHGMPHVYMFTCYALLIYYTPKWYKTPSYKGSIIIGGLVGLMALARPTELVAALIPLLYGIKSFSDIRDRIKLFFGSSFKYVATAIVLCAFIGFWQLLYWKIYAGEWIYNSYNNPGEGLDLHRPNLINYLFSYRKGWLLYTPIMLLAIFGFSSLYRRKREWFWPALITSCVYIYVASSWSTWWYATSFSQRSMIHIYPLLALPLGALLLDLWERRKLLYGVLGVGMLFVLFNVFQTWQYHSGIIDMSRMTKKYYWMVFGKNHVPDGAKDYLLVNRSFNGVEKFDNKDHYDKATSHYLMTDGAKLVQGSSPALVRVEPGAQTPPIEIPFSSLTEKDHAWVTLIIKPLGQLIPNEGESVFISTFVHNHFGYKFNQKDISHHLVDHPDGGKIMYYEYLTPEVRTPSDFYQFYIVNTSDRVLEFEYILMETFERQDKFN